MKLIEALSILSKSSPYAVSTERDSKDTLSEYKDYIHIETDIQRKFHQTLTSNRGKKLIFLCGSSGDGKSEILTKYSQEYKSLYDFHLDATHSFNPSQNAIEALDECFSNYKVGSRTLIVGINTGMLANYEKEGSEQHNDVRREINAFLQHNHKNIPSDYQFIDFEDYPKFEFIKDEFLADFAMKFMKKLTQPTDDNLFYQLSLNEQAKGSSRICANYYLLSFDSVQKSIIKLLFKARLIKEQFLTARTFLDFIFQLLVRKEYLFDTLFKGGDNELLQKIQSFDPARYHTKNIDKFILQLSLNVADKELDVFRQDLSYKGVYLSQESKSSSYLRLFSLLEGEDFSNSYHNQFNGEFGKELISSYAESWLLHRNFDGSVKHMSQIAKFYRDIVINAIHKFCNRNAMELDKDHFFVAKYNQFITAVELEIEPDFEAFKQVTVKKIAYFSVCLNVDNQALKPILISMNLLELMIKITQGYRPNKHDKSSVLLLEDVVEQIQDIAIQKKTLFIFNKNKRLKITNNYAYFQVSGLGEY